MEIRFQRLTDSATIPARGSPGAAGLDLCADQAGVIPARSWGCVTTGIAASLPVDHVGLVWPRSGMAVKHGIDTLAGVIDCDYRGEIKVVLMNHASTDYAYQAASRIAQLVVQRYQPCEAVEVESLGETIRGVKGFGHTGQ